LGECLSLGLTPDHSNFPLINLYITIWQYKYLPHIFRHYCWRNDMRCWYLPMAGRGDLKPLLTSWWDSVQLFVIRRNTQRLLDAIEGWVACFSPRKVEFFETRLQLSEWPKRDRYCRGSAERYSWSIISFFSHDLAIFSPSGKIWHIVAKRIHFYCI
jgi:hypothetical protein